MDTVTATGKKRNPESPSERSEKMKKHHHHRKKSGYRKKKKFFAGCAAIVLVILGISAAIVWRTWKDQRSHQITASNSFDVGSGYRTVIRDGKKYEYNQTITAVLFAGLDSTEPMGDGGGAYGNKARADSILLAVLDKMHGKMSVIALSRDTMTGIRRYTRTGKDMGIYESHLGYAYSYGDGGKVSCQNLQEAVSELLGGIPVQEYVVTNQSAIEEINRMVGGVTVEVPNDDLKSKHPDLISGAVVTLDDTNVKDFVQYRDTGKDFSNEGRIQRQKAYITSYVDQLRQKLKEDINGMWEKTNQIESYLQTSVTKNKYLTMANLLEKVSFETADYYVPEGENRTTDQFDEFYPDQEALEQMVLDLFYVEA